MFLFFHCCRVCIKRKWKLSFEIKLATLRKRWERCIVNFFFRKSPINVLCLSWKLQKVNLHQGFFKFSDCFCKETAPSALGQGNKNENDWKVSFWLPPLLQTKTKIVPGAHEKKRLKFFKRVIVLIFSRTIARLGINFFLSKRFNRIWDNNMISQLTNQTCICKFPATVCGVSLGFVRTWSENLMNRSFVMCFCILFAKSVKRKSSNTDLFDLGDMFSQYLRRRCNPFYFCTRWFRRLWALDVVRERFYSYSLSLIRLWRHVLWVFNFHLVACKTKVGFMLLSGLLDLCNHFFRSLQLQSLPTE